MKLALLRLSLKTVLETYTILLELPNFGTTVKLLTYCCTQMKGEQQTSWMHASPWKEPSHWYDQPDNATDLANTLHLLKGFNESNSAGSALYKPSLPLFPLKHSLCCYLNQCHGLQSLLCSHKHCILYYSLNLSLTKGNKKA